MIRLSLLTGMCTLLLGGCGQSGGSSYFPAAEGQYWQYDVLVTTMDIQKHHKNIVQSLPSRTHEGQVVLPRQVNHGETNFVLVNDEGYWFAASLTAPEVVQVATEQLTSTQTKTASNKPVMLMPLEPEPGMSWSGMSQTHVLEGVVDPFRRLVNISVPVTMNYTIEANDVTVTVPAGVFANCLQVRGIGQGYYDGDKTIRKMDITVDQTDWYAPGVGLIKRQRKEDSDSKIISHGEYIEELEVHNH